MSMTTGTVAPPSNALEVSAAIRRGVASLARRLRAERPEHGVSLAKLSVLGRLHRLSSMSAAELAGRERIQPQSLTRLVADLEQGGFIRRRDDETDGRRVLIDLTASGKDLLTRDMRQRDAWLALAMSSELTATEQEVLRLAAHLMERLADARGATVERRSTLNSRSPEIEASVQTTLRLRRTHP